MKLVLSSVSLFSAVLGLAVRVLCLHKVAVAPIPKRVVANSQRAHIAPADYAYMQIAPEEEALAQLITECQGSMHDGPQLVRTGTTIKADNIRTQLVRTVSEEALFRIKAGLQFCAHSWRMQ